MKMKLQDWVTGWICAVSEGAKSKRRESKALLLRLWREKPAFADEGAWRGPGGACWPLRGHKSLVLGIQTSGSLAQKWY